MSDKSNPWLNEGEPNVWAPDSNDIISQLSDNSDVENEQVNIEESSDNIDSDRESDEDVMTNDVESNAWNQNLGNNKDLNITESGSIAVDLSEIIKSPVSQTESDIGRKCENIEEDHETPLVEEVSENEEFGDFEDFQEVPKPALIFENDVNGLLDELFPCEDSKQQPELLDKSFVLRSRTTMPMKCYNIISAENRQFKCNTIALLNTVTRGCVERTAAFQNATEIADEWIVDDRGIDVTKGKKNSNIFGWSTSTEGEALSEGNACFSNQERERKNIKQRLVNASFERARKLVDDRVDVEKREKLLLEKQRQEKEQRLKDDLMKKEETLARYSNDTKDILHSDKNSRKKGFFDRIFVSKSKIAKDSISHKKMEMEMKLEPVIDEPAVKELSLREQMEMEGYILSEQSKRKHKKKKRKLRKKQPDDESDYDDHDQSDDEDEDDDQDEDTSDEEVSAIDGYNVLDPSFLDNNSVDLNVQPSGEASEVEEGDTDHSDTGERSDDSSVENESFGQFCIGTTGTAGPDHHAISSDEEEFEDFQSPPPPTLSKGTNSNTPIQQPNREISLIDL